MRPMMTTLVALAAGGLLLPAVACAGEPTFAARPSAVDEGEAVRIRFAAASACDVEVAILDADGTEVRHLAAGRLGGKEAAAPLAPESLQQSLLWDRKDDWGRPVAGKAFKVRVRLGLRAAGARPLLKAERAQSPYHTAGVITDPDPADAGRQGLTAEELANQAGKAWAAPWAYGWRLMTDREDDRLYAVHMDNTWYRYIGATGTSEPFDTKRFLEAWESFRIGPGGEIHISPFRKLTRDLQEIPPLEGVPQREGCNRFNVCLWHRWRAGPFVEHWRTANRSPELGLDGRYYIYVAVSIPYGYFCVFDRWENKRALSEGFQPWLSYSNKSDGGHFGCVRVDTKGKVYIAAGGAPKGEHLPDSGLQRLFSYGTYGSIVRFDLEGRWAEDFPLPMGAPPKDPEELNKGILWNNGVFMPRVEKCYAGVMSWLWAGCVCSGSTFDLDEYGRLYVPDAGRDSVVVLDNAGNEVLRIAKTVAAGPDGKGTAIHVGWPHRVACTRRAIYFGEDLSRRVIRVGLGHATEERCDVQ